MHPRRSPRGACDRCGYVVCWCEGGVSRCATCLEDSLLCQCSAFVPLGIDDSTRPGRDPTSQLYGLNTVPDPAQWFSDAGYAGHPDDTRALSDGSSGVMPQWPQDPPEASGQQGTRTSHGDGVGGVVRERWGFQQDSVCTNFIPCAAQDGYKPATEEAGSWDRPQAAAPYEMEQANAPLLADLQQATNVYANAGTYYSIPPDGFHIPQLPAAPSAGSIKPYPDSLTQPAFNTWRPEHPSHATDASEASTTYRLSPLDGPSNISANTPQALNDTCSAPADTPIQSTMGGSATPSPWPRARRKTRSAAAATTPAPIKFNKKCRRCSYVTHDLCDGKPGQQCSSCFNADEDCDFRPSKTRNRMPAPTAPGCSSRYPVIALDLLDQAQVASSSDPSGFSAATDVA